ncbi:Hypothetical protein D9617_47g010650 [Elsinoe fawcettii]|nr:Hypothetical protein D9617_47g010650 [Elsinoe fawcettii]
MPADIATQPQEVASHIESGQTPWTDMSDSVSYSTSVAPAKFTLQDMALLHHWTVSTGATIVNDAQASYIWQATFPRIGFQHGYVMHGLLGLAGLHAAHGDTRNRLSFLRDAAYHHTEAMTGLREDMSSVGPHNGDALFTGAIISFFHAFASFSDLYDDQSEDIDDATRTSKILGSEWMPLVRGTQVVLNATFEYVKAGPLSDLLNIGDWDEIDLGLQSAPDDEEFLRLSAIWSGQSNAQVYNETLTLLRRTVTWMTKLENHARDEADQPVYNREWSAPFMWLLSVPSSYVALQVQRQPAALILFAYFGALLERLDRYWWMEGCGKSIVIAVDKCLGSYWSKWLEIPKKRVGML